MKKSLIILSLSVACLFAQAQSFLIPVEGFIGAQPTTLVTAFGDTIKGEIRSAVFMNGLMKSLVFKTESSDEKLKFKAEDVKYLKIRASKMANLESMAAGASSFTRMSKTDFDQIQEREFIEFEQALQPGGKDKFVLLQLLNPGFDSKIKVYSDPNGPKAATTSINGFAVAGGEDNSYLVVKGGIKAERIRKRDYDDYFAVLFGDCPELIKNYSDNNQKISFRDMATHIFDYDQSCK